MSILGIILNNYKLKDGIKSKRSGWSNLAILKAAKLK